MGRNWISNVLYCLVVTFSSGFIIYLIFLSFRNKMEKYGLFTLLYNIMKSILASFFIPFVYIIRKLYSINWGIPNDGLTVQGYFDNYKMTPVLYYFMQITFLLWLLIFIKNILKYGKLIIAQTKMNRTAIPCEQQILKKLRMATLMMRVKKKINIKYSDYICNPVLTGVINPTILLPQKSYSDKELNIIFFHEIQHYIQKDVLWRYITLIVSCIYLIPQRHNFLLRYLEEYSELSCDEHVLDKCDYSIKSYYMTIAKMHFHEANNKFLPGLYEDRIFLERRAVKMRNFKKMKSNKNAFIFLILFVLCNLLVFGTTSKASDLLFNEISEKTYVEDLEKETEIEFQEHVEHDFHSNEEIIEINPYTRGTNNINWNISANSSIRTSYFYKTKGSTITIMVSATPASGTIKAGIIEPDGSRRYVNSANGIASYTFTVNKTGDHAVYIENTGSYKLTVTGVFVN